MTEERKVELYHFPIWLSKPMNFDDIERRLETLRALLRLMERIDLYGEE